MDTRKAFGKALRQIRKARGLTQEDFSVVSSRTYLSTLERGMKSPTLEKVEALAGMLKIHPLALLALTYLYAKKYSHPDLLWKKVLADIQELDVTAKQ